MNFTFKYPRFFVQALLLTTSVLFFQCIGDDEEDPAPEKTLSCTAPASAEQLTALTAGNSKTWRLDTANGAEQESNPDCNNSYTFTSDGKATRTLSVCNSSPLVYNNTFALCADGTLYMEGLTTSNTDIRKHEVLTLTASSLSIRSTYADNTTVVYELVPR